VIPLPGRRLTDAPQEHFQRELVEPLVRQPGLGQLHAVQRGRQQFFALPLLYDFVSFDRPASWTLISFNSPQSPCRRSTP
jgi:hypothetical protein